ncbi:MAG: glutathione S-transferase [Pseudomonadota bacterium]
MKIYEQRSAPNPRRVRIFLAEKGLLDQVTFVQLDMDKGELETEAFARKNAWQRVPVLELDDGTCLAETVAICRYLEELHPEPSLFGRSALERAQVEMWNRRVELGFFFQISQAFRHTHPAMAPLETPQVPAWGEANKARALQSLARLNDALAERRFIAADVFTVADITAMCAVNFMRPVRLKRPEGLEHLERWYSEVTERPSATA